MTTVARLSLRLEAEQEADCRRLAIESFTGGHGSRGR